MKNKTLKEKMQHQIELAELGHVRKKNGARLSHATIDNWKKAQAKVPDDLMFNKEDGERLLIILQEDNLAQSTIRTFCTIYRQFGLNINRPADDEDKEPFTLPAEWVEEFMNRPLVFGWATKLPGLVRESCLLMMKIGINSCLRPVDLLNVGIDNLHEDANGKKFFAIKHQKRSDSTKDKVVRSYIHPQLLEDLIRAKDQWQTSFFVNRMRPMKEVGVKYSWQNKRLWIKRTIIEEMERTGIADKSVFVNGELTTYRENAAAKCLRPSGANWLHWKGNNLSVIEKIGGWAPGSTSLREKYISPNIDIF